MKDFLKEINAKIEGEIIQLGRKYYLINKELENVNKQINRRPEYIGIYLGEKKKQFEPSPAFIDLASKNSEEKVKVNEKAEWMFLCGNDVFAENADKKGKQTGTVFIQNEHDENIGLGKWTKSKGKTIIKNSLDKGNYIRRND